MLNFCEGTFLGFDFGTKYLGIAVGQSITKTATPLLTLLVKNGIPHWPEIAQVIQEWQPKGFIIGLALQPDNSHSATSLKAQKFGARLQAQFSLPIYFIEERLTSVAAREKIRDNPKACHLQDVDAIAAAIILESWLNNPKENSIHVSNQPTIG